MTGRHRTGSRRDGLPKRKYRLELLLWYWFYGGMTAWFGSTTDGGFKVLFVVITGIAVINASAYTLLWDNQRRTRREAKRAKSASTGS